MQDQIEEFVATLNREFAHQARRQSPLESKRSLIPVVQTRTPAVVEMPKKKRQEQVKQAFPSRQLPPSHV
jgi:hypothetical protein